MMRTQPRWCLLLVALFFVFQCPVFPNVLTPDSNEFKFNDRCGELGILVAISVDQKLISRNEGDRLSGDLMAALAQNQALTIKNGNGELTDDQFNQLNQEVSKNSSNFASIESSLAPKMYTVKKNDNLWKIAKKFLKDPYLWPLLVQQENNLPIPNPENIIPGTKIHIYPFILSKDKKEAADFASFFKGKSYKSSDYESFIFSKIPFLLGKYSVKRGY
jgi:LysM repeat protein